MSTQRVLSWERLAIFKKKFLWVWEEYSRGVLTEGTAIWSVSYLKKRNNKGQKNDRRNLNTQRDICIICHLKIFSLINFSINCHKLLKNAYVMSQYHNSKIWKWHKTLKHYVIGINVKLLFGLYEFNTTIDLSEGVSPRNRRLFQSSV